MISPETLRRFSLFAGLDSAVIEDLATAGEEVEFKRSEWLFKEGNEADALYLVLNGSVDLKINLDETGTRQTVLSEVAEGNVTGWSALVEPYVYTLSAIATTATKAVKLDAAKLRVLMDKDTTIGYALMGRLARALARRLTRLRIQFVSFVE